MRRAGQKHIAIILSFLLPATLAAVPPQAPPQAPQPKASLARKTRERSPPKPSGAKEAVTGTCSSMDDPGWHGAAHMLTPRTSFTAHPPAEREGPRGWRF